MHIELSIGDNSGIVLSEVGFLSCIFVGIAAMVAFVSSTLQLDFLNGFNSWILQFLQGILQGGVLPVVNLYSLFCKNHITIYIQSSENDLPCTQIKYLLVFLILLLILFKFLINFADGILPFCNKQEKREIQNICF